MLATRRTIAAGLRLRATGAFSTSSRLGSDYTEPSPANNPNPKPANSPISSTNATPLSSKGAMDTTIVESVEEGEEKRVLQAPNRATVWSRSQNPREKAMVGPRFEQTLMEDQVGARSKLKEASLANWSRVATTNGRDRSHSQAARPLDQGEAGIVRRRWRTARTSEDLHQRRQAADLRVHVLRSPVRECMK